MLQLDRPNAPKLEALVIPKTTAEPPTQIHPSAPTPHYDTDDMEDLPLEELSCPPEPAVTLASNPRPYHGQMKNLPLGVLPPPYQKPYANPAERLDSVAYPWI